MPDTYPFYARTPFAYINFLTHINENEYIDIRGNFSLKEGDPLRQPFEKFIRLELMALSLMFVIGLIALIKKSTFLILLCLFLLGFSLLFEGLKNYHTYQQMDAIKQIVKAVMAFLFAIYLIFAI